MIYTISTAKGGTAKTTTAAALAQAAAFKKKKALAIDFDPQGNLTFALAADPRQPGSYDLLQGTPINETIQRSPQGMDVISASPALQTEKSGTGSARRLQRAIEPIKDNYDIIIIDTPATAGELQYNALQAADRLIISLETDTFSVQALYQIADAAAQIQKSNPDLRPAGVIITRYEGAANFNKYMKDQIERTAADLNIPFLGAVRKGIAAKEAIGFQQSIFEYAPKSNPAADYMTIYKEITKGNKQEG